MKRPSLIAAAVTLVVALLIVGSTFYQVGQTQQAIVLEFGRPVRVVKQPGLHVKIPFVQDVVYYDSRILDLEPEAVELQLSDLKRIIVNSYVRYRIVDPLTFYRSVRTAQAFDDRFGAILNAAVRDALGSSSLTAFLTVKRVQVMNQIGTEVRQRAGDFGIKVVDIRITRTKLPNSTSKSVYNRMRSNREARAALIRADGKQAKITIEADADRKRTVILADADRQAQILRGQGDAERNRILGAAYDKDPAFFRFYRSLAAYRQALGKNTTMVLGTQSEFFRYLQDQPGSLNDSHKRGRRR